jgi:hypothetical protein
MPGPREDTKEMLQAAIRKHKEEISRLKALLNTRKNAKGKKRVSRRRSHQ